MMRSLTAAALLAITTFPAHGQTILLTRELTQPAGLIPTGSPMALGPRGIYVAGTFNLPGNIEFQAFVRRYDPSGNEQWVRPIAAAESVFTNALAVDATAVYVVGRIGLGAKEAFVRKYDDGGNEAWSRQFRIERPGAPGYQEATGVAADSSGVYVAAWNGFADGLVRKYSPAGNELWSRQIPVRSMGRVATDGTSVYVLGSNDAGGFIRKYTTGGDEVWGRQIAATRTQLSLASAVAVDASGVYVGGTTYLRGGADGSFLPDTGDALVLKFDANGNELWSRQIVTSSRDYATAVTLDANGVYLAGGTEGALPGQCKSGFEDAFVRKYDASGNEQWTRQFGTSGQDLLGGLAVDSTAVYAYFSGVHDGRRNAFLTKLGKTQTAMSDSRPQISWECVVNAASYAGGGVAPGEIVTIFGRSMGPSELTRLRLGEDGGLATTLADTRIFFNEIAAPLVYVSATQSSAIVPRAVSEKSTVVVQVEYRGVRSDPLTLPVAPSRPGIFTLNGSGSGPGAILNEDGSLNSAAEPARRGSIILLYLTGEGLTDVAGPDGAIVGSVLPRPRAPVSVLFEDPAESGTIYPAEVLYVGGVSGSVAGLLQVNVRAPPWTRLGNAVPVYVQVGTEFAEYGVTVALTR